MRGTLRTTTLAAACFALGLGAGIAVTQLRHNPTDSPGKSAETKEEEPPEDFVVRLEKEKWHALALDRAEPEKASLPPHRTAYGRVLDPLPLLTLDEELSSAEAALAVTRAENERLQKLLASGENTSRKNAEAAQAQFRADEIKLKGLQRRAQLEWGALAPVNDPEQRGRFVDALAHGEKSLVRVDLLPGDALTETPIHARMLILGRESIPVETHSLCAASAVDPKTQAQGFHLLVDHPPFPLRPGMALSAWLQLPGNARPGFLLPRSAVLRHDGRTWVYVQEEEEKFVRKPVTLDTPMDDDRGWFVSETAGGIHAEDLLVLTGAQSLLSEELKAQGGSEPD